LVNIGQECGINMEKIYTIRKFVIAKSVLEAIKKEKKQQVDDCWADEIVHKEGLESKMKKSAGIK